MTDALSEISREERRQIEITKTLNELSLHIWHYAKKRPKGELREMFVTDMLEAVCDRLVQRLCAFEKEECPQDVLP